MAYLISKGKRVFGDIIGEDDSDGDSGIDFGEDRIDLQTNGSTRLKISGSNGQITFNEEYTFPHSDGNRDQVLATDGDGAVSWVNPGAPATPEVLIVHLGALFNFTTSTTNESQTVPFNTVLKNTFPDGSYNTSTYLFTAPEEGYYDISLSLYHQNMNNVSQYQLRISSSCSWAESLGAIGFSQRRPDEHEATSTWTHQINRVAHLSGSDTVGVTLRTINSAEEGSSVHNGRHLTWLTIRKL